MREAAVLLWLLLERINQPNLPTREETVKAKLTAEITTAVGEVGIGETLIMPSLFGRCYAATGPLASTFVIQSILGTTTATESSPAVETTEEISLGWNERFVLQQGYGVRFTIT